MAMKLTSLAALAQGCAAFVPAQSSLRSTAPVTHSQQAQANPASPASSGVSPSVVVGATVAAAAALASVSNKKRGVARKIGGDYEQKSDPTTTNLQPWPAKLNSVDIKTTAPPPSSVEFGAGWRAVGWSGQVGVTAPIYEMFDPMNFSSTPEKFARYTEVEIKHGRVAMIATMGYIVPEFFHFPGCENFGNGLSALSTIPGEGLFQLVALVGAHEAFIKPKDPAQSLVAVEARGADFGLGSELLVGANEEELWRKQTVERTNGRLAMVAIMGMMVQDGMFGADPISYMKREGWWGEPVDFIVKDIPMCSFGCALPLEKRPRAGLTAMRAVVYEDPSPGAEAVEREMSVACPFLVFPQQLKGWVGGEKGFDPIGLSDFLPVYQLRECELKHGRFAMLATIGWIATDLGWRFPGEVFQNTTTIGAHDACLKAGYMQPFLGSIGVFELYGGYLWFQGMSNNMGSGDLPRDAGDYFVGKQFLPKDEEKANEMKLRELENGRLAMLAFGGIVTEAVATQKPWPFF